ncbi:MAG TPA: AFG1/ZapE family ATPase, partial [Rhodanobacteraceae bacterium]|nr:AFG1/ZapE family ATPase [Rhodanobacteraceae bacterium]
MSDGLALAPGERYREGVTAARWQDDPAQHPALCELDRLHAALVTPTPEADGLFGRLKSLFADDDTATPLGLYLWGDVGRGKTFLMDLFAASLPHGVALRRHFHDFMAEVQAELRRLGERQNPLTEVAAGLAARCRVLCLDEFLVEDI